MINRFVDRYDKWIFPFPAVAFILVLMVFPLGYTIWNSFTGWSLTAGVSADFQGFQNYVKLFTSDARFVNAIGKMFYFTAVAMFFEVLLGVAAAFMLDYKEYKGKRIVNSILLLPMMATPVAVAMVWLLMYEPTAGVINFVLKELHLPISLWIADSKTVIPALALIDVWEWTPLVTLITLAGLTALPSEPFEAAKVDGANLFQTIWYITLPMLMPTISVAALLRLIDCLKTFDIIYTMTGGGPGVSSETLNIYTYQQGFYYYNFGYASAILILFFVMVMGVSLFVAYSRKRVENSL